MGNKLTNLNNILFAQLERLNDTDLKGEALDREITRSQAVSTIAKEITANGNLVLKAHIAVANKMLPDEKLPTMIGGSDNAE